jgi:hypothetical protein
MPELSRFYGIIIRMYSEPSERHNLPHFHAYYQERVAVFSISPIVLVAGWGRSLHRNNASTIVPVFG